MFDWVQMLTATSLFEKVPVRSIITYLWHLQKYHVLHWRLYYRLPSPVYIPSQDQTASERKPVKYKITLLLTSHISKGPLQIPSQFLLVNNKLWNNTWSVGRRLKSLGGFVITYLLPGASGPALLSRNLQGKYSNHCGTHFQVAKVLPNFKLPKSFQRMLLLKFIQVCWGKNPFTFVQWIFLQYFELLWQETQFESIVQMCKKTVFASIDKIC